MLLADKGAFIIILDESALIVTNDTLAVVIVAVIGQTMLEFSCSMSV